MLTFIHYLVKNIKLNKGLSDLSITEHREIYKEWKNQIKSKKQPLDCELPWITLIAKTYIENYLSGKQKSNIKIFEYGSGGSTLFFLKYAHEVVSVEHDEAWFELVKKTVEKKAIEGWYGYLRLPEKVTSSFTHILSPSNPHHYYTTSEAHVDCIFKQYVTSIDNYMDNYFDVVLVDGRSRPSCIYHAIKKIKKKGLLVLDNAERKYYLKDNIIDESEFELIISSNGALICSKAFTQTNIYVKIK